MQGFVIDGYPRTVSQAMALEKELTGLDLPAELEYTAAAVYSSSAGRSRPVSSFSSAIAWDTVRG